jgi:hypothetical protein
MRRGTPQAQLVSPPLSSASFRLARPPLRNVCADAYWAVCARGARRGCGWWNTAQRLLAAGGKSPARRDKRDMFRNVLVARAVHLLPVHGKGEKVHGLGLEPCSFWPEPCAFWAGSRRAVYCRNWNTCKVIFSVYTRQPCTQVPVL